MQATQEPKTTQAKNATNSHDPILTAEDEAFLRQVMAQPGNAEPGASTSATDASPAPADGGAGGNSGDAVPAPTSPVPEDTQRIEEFGKSLGEQQRRPTSELKEGGDDGKKEDKKKDEKEGKKEGEEKKDEGEAAGAGEKKKKRWSMHWPWKKGSKEKVGRCMNFYL